MGTRAEISLINLNMTNNDKENKEDNNTNGVCDSGNSATDATIEKALAVQLSRQMQL